MTEQDKFFKLILKQALMEITTIEYFISHHKDNAFVDSALIGLHKSLNFSHSLLSEESLSKRVFEISNCLNVTPYSHGGIAHCSDVLKQVRFAIRCYLSLYVVYEEQEQDTYDDQYQISCNEVFQEVA